MTPAEVSWVSVGRWYNSGNGYLSDVELSFLAVYSGCCCNMGRLWSQAGGRHHSIWKFAVFKGFHLKALPWL
ncbi:hypothetical protein F9C07_5771 [Aspergillus flavus]|uniref:Uncharacterized protein n=1 Tax=Aspergillus flavus (strain ATCC 200026 / FGSC A1120 / IAM 13836 / NRRL 3357 / JCM 12722 / SRRC 167) TaxID=332952 RepID=A0A7U2R0L1_ASPFN|nr:hypothetical protein F9C07_5771 [Aspergillus flavus]